MTLILLAVVGLVVLGVVVVLALASRKPATFRYERRAVIAAPPEAIFPNINDFRRWAEWSPWEKLDPAMKKTYGGAPSGVGATYGWIGAKAGEGTMVITESRPSEYLALDLAFIKPFPAQNKTVFTLAPKAGGTEVVWTMTGDNTFMGKVFGVFVDMDQMIGKDFERGLVDLKRVSEATGSVSRAS
jgi:hypothetical protein